MSHTPIFDQLQAETVAEFARRDRSLRLANLRHAASLRVGPGAPFLGVAVVEAVAANV